MAARQRQTWWIGEDDSLRLLRAEADGDAKRLGHGPMTTWFRWPNGEWSSTCLRCGGHAWLAPRDMRALSSRGDALQLACKPPGKRP